MQEGEASEGVATDNMINIDAAMTATGRGLLRITDTDVVSAEESLLLTVRKLTIRKLSPVLRDNMLVQFTMVISRRQLPPKKFRPVSYLIGISVDLPRRQRRRAPPSLGVDTPREFENRVAFWNKLVTRFI